MDPNFIQKEVDNIPNEKLIKAINIYFNNNNNTEKMRNILVDLLNDSRENMIIGEFLEKVDGIPRESVQNFYRTINLIRQIQYF